MLLAIDIGNSFVKWTYLTPTGAQVTSRAALQEWLLAPLRHFKERPDRVAIANVAGDEVRATLSAALAAWQVPVHWLVTQADAYGVRNGYQNPTQLGVDRWLGLVAARADIVGSCVVASIGTAMTVDMLTASGEFLGGVIVPGPELMRSALTQGTAGVAPATGRLVDFPRSTADAVETGIALALLGAIDRAVATLAREVDQQVTLLLGGGAAGGLVGSLNMPHRLVDNLPLRGLHVIAEQEGWL